ncbi:MAG TPA: AMP-binding protein [Acidimicrobiia bacterium]|nr:AMP-binding protein [Acidimicrobiia bacterium]
MALLIGNVLRHAARYTPRRLAATLGDAELTFGELDDRANRVAHTLAGMGVGLGDRVAWWGDTSLEPLPIFFALAKLGAVFAPVNARLGPDEAAAVIGYARPRVLVTDDAHAELVQEIDVPIVTHAHLFEEATRASGVDIGAPRLDERDPHVIFFTSGSTGRPKGVVLSHRASCLRSFPPLAADSDGGTVCMFPLFHMAGWSLGLGCWHSRRPIHFVHLPDAETLLDTVERRGATRVYLIPAVWARVLEHGVEKHDVSSLVEADTGTSATPPELVTAIRDALPHTVTRIFYGSTEAGPGTVLAHADLGQKPGSVGLPQPGVDVRLENGEVCIRSDLLMDGYFDQPDATAEAMRDGWYHTGDLGSLDDEGYLSIVGRARDVIRTGGETVAPAEVEAALATYPAVREVAVVGVPDQQWGEIVCAVVVPEPDAGDALDLDDLRAHSDAALAAFKQPRRLEIVDALPRTPATGQVQRTLLVERIASTTRTRP